MNPLSPNLSAAYSKQIQERTPTRKQSVSHTESDAFLKWRIFLMGGNEGWFWKCSSSPHLVT